MKGGQETWWRGEIRGKKRVDEDEDALGWVMWVEERRGVKCL